MTLPFSLSADRVALAVVAALALLAFMYAVKCRSDLAAAMAGDAIGRAQSTSKGL